VNTKTSTIYPISSFSQDVLKNFEEINPERCFGVVFASRNILLQDYELEKQMEIARKNAPTLLPAQVRAMVTRIPRGRLLWCRETEEYDSIEFNPEIVEHWQRFHHLFVKLVLGESVAELLGAATAASIAALIEEGCNYYMENDDEHMLPAIAGPASVWYRATRQVLMPGSVEPLTVDTGQLYHCTRRRYEALIECGFEP